MILTTYSKIKKSQELFHDLVCVCVISHVSTSETQPIIRKIAKNNNEIPKNLFLFIIISFIF